MTTLNLLNRNSENGQAGQGVLLVYVLLFMLICPDWVFLDIPKNKHLVHAKTLLSRNLQNMDNLDRVFSVLGIPERVRVYIHAYRGVNGARLCLLCPETNYG